MFRFAVRTPKRAALNSVLSPFGLALIELLPTAAIEQGGGDCRTLMELRHEHSLVNNSAGHFDMEEACSPCLGAERKKARQRAEIDL